MSCYISIESMSNGEKTLIYVKLQLTTLLIWLFIVPQTSDILSNSFLKCSFMKCNKKLIDSIDKLLSTKYSLVDPNNILNLVLEALILFIYLDP